MRKLLISAAALALAVAMPAEAQQSKVGSATPQYGVPVLTDCGGTLCWVTNSGGGGGSLSAKANAASQTSVEGATTDPLSMDLHRSLRILMMDAAGNSVSPATAGNQTAVQGTFGAITANRSVTYDSAGNAVNWTNPAGVQGVDAANVASDINPLPTSRPPGTATDLGITPVASTAAEACHVLKASAGNLYSVSGYGGQAEFVMVFNLASAPADGAVTPAAWAYLPAAGSWSINYGDLPQVHSTGITVCYSSTGPLSKTAISTNNVFSGRVK